jgi:hypothetical protein
MVTLVPAFIDTAVAEPIVSTEVNNDATLQYLLGHLMTRHPMGKGKKQNRAPLAGFLNVLLFQ